MTESAPETSPDTDIDADTGIDADADELLHRVRRGAGPHGPARDRVRARCRHRPPQAGHRAGPAHPGTGQWTVNGRKLDEYFPNKVHQQLVNDPFVTLEIDKRFDVIARIHGGGVSGQAGALRLAIARALNLIDEDGNRPALKRAGFLTRDPRAKERKKYGLKKARKAPQYSKR